MRTNEQIEKKVKKLERKLKILNKYKDKVNFDVSNAGIPASDYMSYEKEIKYVEGQLKVISWLLDEEQEMTAKTFTLEFLSEQTLVTEGLEYSSDEDGNISIHQENMFITLTPKQALDLKALLTAHLDTLKFAWSKR